MGETGVAAKPRYVAIEGPIGVGKTTLARRLAQSLSGRLILEKPEDNPFLDDFYAQPDIYALPTQLKFLIDRRDSLRHREPPTEQRPWIADFLFAKDRLFASLTLESRQLALYQNIANELAFDLVLPDLVVYLQAPLEVLYDRIERRGKASEQAIASAYIARLQRAYTEYFHDYVETPVLIVNAAEIDFAGNDYDYDQLLSRITGINAGRHYFNPSPAAV